MSGAVFIVLVSRIGLAIAAGEIAIRYFDWWWCTRKGSFVTTSVILAIAISAFGVWEFEAAYMFVRSTPKYIEYHDLSATSPGIYFFELGRLILLTSSVFFAYPVIVVHYGQNWKQAMIEMIVRLFLIIMTAFGVWELATVHYCSHLAGC